LSKKTKRQAIGKKTDSKKEKPIESKKFIKYRWSLYILLIGGILSIAGEFLPIEAVQQVFHFNLFETFLISPNLFFILPIIGGGIMLVAAVFAYTEPKYTILGIVGGTLTFFVGIYLIQALDFARAAFPSMTILTGAAPIVLLISGGLGLLSYLIRNKE